VSYLVATLYHAVSEYWWIILTAFHRAWIYGGAFVAGGSANYMTDGANMAAFQDVIVVSFNYRVNGE